MRVLLPILVVSMLVSPLSAEEAESIESTFVACLAEKQPALISQIRDADSQKAFEGAMKSALEVCPTETDKLSMGKLFKALAAATKATDAEGAV